MFALLRIAIGALFLVSGAGKAMAPYQNFKYVIEAYALLPGWAETAVAQVLPWVEIFTGMFLVLGLWNILALKSAAVLFGLFIVVVGQALLRGLPMGECGCFGELLHVPPHITVVMDSAMLLLTMVLLRRPQGVQVCSLDKFLAK